MSFWMKTSSTFYVYVMTTTSSGIRYLKYVPGTGTNYMEANGKYIVIYAGNGLTDGAWHYIERNLSDDLHSVESGNTLLDVDGIAIRNASMYLDDLRFSNQETKTVYSLQAGAIGFIISSRDAATSNDTWYHYDRLGTVMNLTDDAGAVSATYDQDAFGNVLSGNASGFHLTTKDYNPTIGLYYFYQRWYDPMIGLFNTKDAYYSINRYLYCLNNPIQFIDSEGLKTRTPLEEHEKKCRKEAKEKSKLVKGGCATKAQNRCGAFQQCMERLGHCCDVWVWHARQAYFIGPIYDSSMELRSGVLFIHHFQCQYDCGAGEKTFDKWPFKWPGGVREPVNPGDEEEHPVYFIF